jgi:hypothetical protein
LDLLAQDRGMIRHVQIGLGIAWYASAIAVGTALHYYPPLVKPCLIAICVIPVPMSVIHFLKLYEK